MELHLRDLRYREVIDVSSGERLGYVSDALIDSTDGRIAALIVPGEAKLLGLLGRENDRFLPWNAITRLGGDTLLVDASRELRRRGKG